MTTWNEESNLEIASTLENGLVPKGSILRIVDFTLDFSDSTTFEINKTYVKSAIAKLSASMIEVEELEKDPDNIIEWNVDYGRENSGWVNIVNFSSVGGREGAIKLIEEYEAQKASKQCPHCKQLLRK